MPATRIPWKTDGRVSWDTLGFGRPEDVRNFPGLASVKAKSELDFEAPKAKGKRGANIKAQGLKLVDLTIKLRVWTREQHEALQPLLPLLLPADTADRGGKGDPPEPRAIVHPVAALHRVTQCVVLGFEGPESEGGQFDEYTITAKQHLPPPPKGVGGKVAAKSGKDQAAVDELFRQYAEVQTRRTQVYLQGTSTPAEAAARETELNNLNAAATNLERLIRERQGRLYGVLPPSAPPAAGSTAGTF